MQISEIDTRFIYTNERWFYKIPDLVFNWKKPNCINFKYLTINIKRWLGFNFENINS